MKDAGYGCLRPALFSALAVRRSAAFVLAPATIRVDLRHARNNQAAQGGHGVMSRHNRRRFMAVSLTADILIYIGVLEGCGH